MRTPIGRIAVALCVAAWVVAKPFPVAAQGLGGGPSPAAPTGPRDIDFRTRVSMSGGPRYSPETGLMVESVRILGNENVSSLKVQSMLRTKKGRLFDPLDVQNDVKRLTNEGLFRNVRTYTRPTESGGIEVTFEVFERPTIRYVRFVGNRLVSDKRLLQESGIKVGDALMLYSVEEARRRVEEYYRNHGYAKTQVIVGEGNEPQHRGVVFLIHEGRFQRISKVDFIGNTIATDARLKTQIKSKPGILYYFGGGINFDKIDEDQQRLTAYYRNLGYFSAVVGRELVPSDDGKWGSLTFVIREGPRYELKGVALEGNTQFTTESLMSHLDLHTGEHFNMSKMQHDVNTLKDLYGGHGYIFADVKPNIRYLDEPGQLMVVYSVEEGKQFKVGDIRVHIQGEFPHTERNVVLNRLSFQPGDVIDIRKIRASERRLKASQLFANDPARNAVPRIVIRPPELTSLDEAVAEDTRDQSIRGQSPDSETERAVLDVYCPPTSASFTGR
ncbi:MAG: hypothetical protein KDA60_10430 [Planctomycetales bacterium]|nr:hypothetical protein [Planctomycetales bacterium]